MSRGWVVGQIGWGGLWTPNCLHDIVNRASSSSPNPASDGGTWTVFAGTYGVEVISGVAHLYNSGYGFWPTGGSASNNNGPDPLGGNPAMGRDLGSAVQDVTWRIHCDDATDRFVMVNFDPATRSAYMLDTNGSTVFRLWRSPSNAGGSRTLLASFTFTAFTTSTVRIMHDGAGNLEVFQDGASLGVATDSSPLTGTWVGVADATNGNTHSANWWDSFSACPSSPPITGPLLSMAQQFTTPTRGASVLSITNSLGSAVTAGNLVVVLFWNASGDAVNNTVSGLSATWTYVRSGVWGMAWAIVPGGGTTVTLSIGATRTMAMTVCEITTSQPITSVSGGTGSGTIQTNFGAPTAAINTDTISVAKTVADFWAIKGNTSAPTTYNDLLPALSWSQLTRAIDSTDTIQFGGALPTARASGTAGIAPTDPTSGVGDTAVWQLVVT